MKGIDKRRKQVLMIECDSRTLEFQNLAVGIDVRDGLQKLFPKNGIDLIKAYDKSDFDADLDIVLRKYKNPCKTVIMIGHGNETGIKLTSNSFMNWHDLSLILEPFAPQQLLFLVCRAGDISACEILFDNIPSLKQIFASPVNVPKSQQYIIIQKVAYTLFVSKEHPLMLNLMQAVNALTTKEWMFSRSREEHEYGELKSKQIAEKGFIAITDWIKKRSNKN